MSAGYDVIVVGGGSAGCAAAARLSEDPSRRVLLLEAGRSAETILIKKPGMVSIIHTVPQVKKQFDWGYKTTPQPGLHDRVIPYMRGKVLGGSSCVNGMVFVRGNRANYDGWAAEGCDGWAYDDVLPYFKKLEDWEGGEDAYRSTGGPIAVSRPSDISPASEAFLQATSGATGVPILDDYNGEQQEGAALFQLSCRDGLRYSTYEGYVKPAMDRDNLDVVLHAQVERILLEGTRAVGVRYRKDGEVVEVRSDGEIILASGAIGSPHLLMLSGIGPAAHLREHGIDVVADLPVGDNLHDHLFAPLTFLAPNAGHRGTPWHFFGGMLKEFLMGGTWFGRSVFETIAFVKTDPDQPLPNLQIHGLPWAYPKDQDNPEVRPEVDMRPALSLFNTLIYPKSRGELRLTGASPDDKPHVDPGFLRDRADLQMLLDGMRVCRDIMAHPAITSELAGELLPGTEITGEALEADIRQRSFTVYHPVGTCRMGADERAVVDVDLRVRGIEGLRVADASIMPIIPAGNTNAPSIMIGERVADLVAKA